MLAGTRFPCNFHNTESFSIELFEIVLGGSEMLRKTVLALAAVVGGTLAANAADLRPVYKAPPAPPPPVIYNWSGFYVGGHGGFAWAETTASRFAVNGVLPPAPPVDPTFDRDGGFGGGQVGWNWQAPGSPWVWGIEGDISGADISGSATVGGITGTADIDMLATIRGRLGYAWDRVMIYGTGGAAWARNELTVSGFGITLTEDRTHSGWVAGGGIEWALWDNWTVKAEYQFLSFDSERFLSGPVAGGIDVDTDIHTIRIGLNYRFGGGYGKSPPVVARY